MKKKPFYSIKCILQFILIFRSNIKVCLFFTLKRCLIKNNELIQCSPYKSLFVKVEQ